MSGTYKDLKAWQRAFDLALSIYRATRAFPKDEIYGLTSQLRRAAVSVVSNIAEGKGRSSDKDVLRFMANARGSLFEMETQIALAGELAYIGEVQTSRLMSDASEVGKILNGLMRALDSDAAKAA